MKFFHETLQISTTAINNNWKVQRLILAARQMNNVNGAVGAANLFFNSGSFTQLSNLAGHQNFSQIPHISACYSI